MELIIKILWEHPIIIPLFIAALVSLMVGLFSKDQNKKIIAFTIFFIIITAGAYCFYRGYKKVNAPKRSAMLFGKISGLKKEKKKIGEVANKIKEEIQKRKENDNDNDDLIKKFGLFKGREKRIEARIAKLSKKIDKDPDLPNAVDIPDPLPDNEKPLLTPDGIKKLTKGIGAVLADKIDVEPLLQTNPNLYESIREFGCYFLCWLQLASLVVRGYFLDNSVESANYVKIIFDKIRSTHGDSILLDDCSVHEPSQLLSYLLYEFGPNFNLKVDYGKPYCEYYCLQLRRLDVKEGSHYVLCKDGSEGPMIIYDPMDALDGVYYKRRELRIT
jgi:hypothetical protein